VSLAAATAGEETLRRRFGAVEITYLEAGPRTADAASLVILHGIGSAARSFRDQLDGLSRTYRVIAWDAPGYGGSTALAPFSPTADDYADRLAAFLDDLQLGNCHLLGHSLGCLMAARFAVRHPERVRSLSLCSIAAGHGTMPAAERQKLLDQRISDVATLGAREMARARGPRLLGPKASSEAIRRVIETMGAIHPAGYSQAAHLLSTGDVKSDVARLPAGLPLQIIYGDADVITPPARNLEVAALRPGVPVTVIPGTGHALYLEQPGLFNAAVARFLEAARA
jgi:pimeloyl-ACP methyl ester carboxylesterase